MIDKKDPITMAYISLFVSFFIFVGIIYLFKPAWVQVANQNTGRLSFSWELVLTSSVTFSLVLSIFVLIIVSNQRENCEQIGYEISSFPNAEC